MASNAQRSAEDREPRYELDDLVDEDLLTDLITTFVRALGLAGGVVRNPKPQEPMPDAPKELREWRYTKVIGFDRDGKPVEDGSEFCHAIRALEEGNRRCMASDLSHAKTAYRKRAAQSYHCEPGRLVDIVAPITVGGHHLANVYLGQLRDDEEGEDRLDKVWRRYHDEILPASAIPPGCPTEKDAIDELYGKLTHVSETLGVETVEALLTRLAELISQRAARQGALLAVSEMSAEISSALDLTDGMQIILRKLHRILRFTSGSIMIRRGKWLDPVACTYPASLEQQMRLPVECPDGVGPHIFREGVTIRFSTLAEMNTFVPPAVAASREDRHLQSFLGTPVVADGEVIGIIEVANNEEQTYTEDDARLIETMARYAGMFYKSERERRAFTSIVRERRLDTLLRSIARTMPPLVHGHGCSIFLRDLARFGGSGEGSEGEAQAGGDFHKLPAFLRATSEFPREFEAYYYPGEGLTGWVLKTGRSLRIPSGPGARGANLLLDPPGTWEGKYRRKDSRKPKEYYEDRPFLAVPIWGAGGRILGVIRIPDCTRGNFTDADEKILETCAAAIAAAVETELASLALQNVSEEFAKVRGELETATSKFAKMQRQAERRADAIATSLAAKLTAALSIAAVVFASAAVLSGAAWPVCAGGFAIGASSALLALLWALKAKDLRKGIRGLDLL
ncbi:GAF domain-containing protein [Planctomycetota bacterium]